MKAKLLSILLGSLVLGHANAADTKALLEEVSKLERLGGSAVGIGGHPGRFYEITLKMKKDLDQAAILKLTKHKNANIAALGLVLLAYDTDKNLKHFVALSEDKREVTTFLASFIEQMTLGEFARLLLADLEARSMYIDALVPADSGRALPVRGDKNAQQDGAEQPATAPEPEPEGKKKPKLESEGRSQ